MKFVGLLSGGKDSLFAVGKAISMGHQLICAANLHCGTEVDSFMFQTAGTLMVPAIASSLNIPLVTRELQGKSNCKTMAYSITAHDEVEDLYELLLEAKYRFPELEAVVSGAVQSDYQRIRVENVCSRLNLTSIAPLWKFNQKDLLLDMQANGYKAIIVKISSMGLQEKHLGMEVSELIDYFDGLNKKFGFNQAGEGGEYETLIIDAPIMKKKLIVQDSEKVVTGNSAYSPYGHLIIKKLGMENKETQETEEFFIQQKKTAKVFKRHGEAFIGEITAESLGQECRNFEDETFCVLKGLKEILESEGMGLTNVYYLNAYIKSMKDYMSFNAVYGRFFNFPNPPSRVCIELSSMDCRVKLSIKATLGKKTCTHVQSISNWAPASIGPYSQAYSINAALHLAGSIPLVPLTMSLSPHTLPQVLSNCEAVAKSNGFALENPESCIVYYTSEKLQVPNVYHPFYVQVTGLPRNAALEIEFHLQKNLPETVHLIEEINETWAKARIFKRHCQELVYLNWYIEVERVSENGLLVDKIGEEIKNWLGGVRHKSGINKEQLLGAEDIVVKFEDYVNEVRVFAPEPYRFKSAWLESVPATFLQSETVGIYISIQDFLQVATYQFINSGN